MMMMMMMFLLVYFLFSEPKTQQNAPLSLLLKCSSCNREGQEFIALSTSQLTGGSVEPVDTRQSLLCTVLDCYRPTRPDHIHITLPHQLGVPLSATQRNDFCHCTVDLSVCLSAPRLATKIITLKTKHKQAR